MVRAPGKFARFQEAESLRRALQAEGALRRDLDPSRTPDGVWFPVQVSDETWEFTERDVRPKSFMDMVDLNEAEQALASRAFEQLGDMAILKIPPGLEHKKTELGDALRSFLGARAVFHDHGVKGTFRTRDLERISGTGNAETIVAENGFQLKVDVTRAYFSPRLADERARLVALLSPGDSVIDLFGGAGPFAVQAARAGAAVVCVDLNPDAIALAQENAARAKVSLECICGDAREVGPTLEPAKHVVMNLPHLAKEFLGVGAQCTAPGGTLHHHEILPDNDLATRCAELVAELGAIGRVATVAHTRHVRNYSPTESHYAIDLELA
ncbi:MAG: class I SAM-dependent methyltransferase [Thermoplasmatota archaeon]